MQAILRPMVDDVGSNLPRGARPAAPVRRPSIGAARTPAAVSAGPHEALREWLGKLPGGAARVPFPAAPGLLSDAAAQAWCRQLGESLFQVFRVSRGHIPRVIGTLSRLEPRRAARVMKVVRPLLDGSASLSAGLDALCAPFRGELEPHDERVVGELCRDLLLRETDLRLQLLYRVWMARTRPSPRLPHDETVAALATGSRPWVDAFLAGLGVTRLAGWRDEREADFPARFLTRLQNFAFDVPLAVTFRFSYHCNLACAHCYNGSGPRHKAQRLEDAAMLAVVAQMAAAGAEVVSLSGGEPFLYPHTVFAMVRQARACGVRRININTNGFWAATAERASALLERLVEAGFRPAEGDGIKVSCGPYHQQAGLPLATLANLARVYQRRFARPLAVDYEAHARSADAVAAVWRELAAHGITPDQVELQLRIVGAIGRGEGVVGRCARGPAEGLGPCTAIGHLAFDPDGRCRPCCGLNNAVEGLVVGALPDDPLRRIVKRMQNHPLLQAMAREPLGELLQWAGVAAPAAGVTATCDVCALALGERDPAAAAALLPERLRMQTRYYPHWLV